MRNYFFYGKYFKQFARKERNKTYSVLAISLLTVLIFGLFAIAPTLKSIARVKKDVATLERLSIQLSRKAEAIDKAKTVFAKTAPYEDFMREAIYPFSGWGRDMEKLSAQARQDRIKLLKVDARRDHRLLTISALGEFPDMERFLAHLEKRNPNYKIRSLDLEGGKDDSPFVKVINAKIGLEVVFIDEQDV